MERPITTERLWTRGRDATTVPVGEAGGEPEAAFEAATGGPLVLGRYRLLSRLGAGGFGVVWRAWDEKLEREVAVKAIAREHAASGRGAARAEREARAAARLNHPGIVALYELADDDEAVYLVSELVRGRTFAELRREGALSDRDVARIGAALCDALAHAHERGVIHRDVKPANVVVAADPAAGAGFAKLTDFGVARLAAGDSLTRTGDVVGTLAYMAPEQAEGERVTPAADVYSLALTMYEGWTGDNPVRAASPAVTARRLGRPIPSLGRRRRDLPAGLCAAVDRALDPRPERRPSPEELRGELREAERALSDEGGLVEPSTLARVGLAWDGMGGRVDGRTAFLARTGAGAAAGGLVLAGLELLAAPQAAAFSPLAAGAVAALLVAILPRMGWLLAAAALLVWLTSPEADQPGTALALAVPLAAVPLLLPRAGRAWSVPALAPLLGIVALAPAYVVVAGMARTAWRRAGLGAAGALWLAAAEALSGDRLLFGAPDGTLPRSDWQGSALDAASDAIFPWLSSPAVLVPLAWAAFAVVLPLVVRGRSLALDVLGAAGWAGALVATQQGLADLLAPYVEAGAARGTVAGPVLAAVAAVAWRALRPPAEAPSEVTPRPVGAPASP